MEPSLAVDFPFGMSECLRRVKKNTLVMKNLLVISFGIKL